MATAMTAAKKEASGMENVYIVCQRCSQPLDLHPSFLEVTSEELGNLAAPLVPEEMETSDTLQDPSSRSGASAHDGIVRRTVARMKGVSTTRQDFSLLTSQPEMGNLAYRLRVTGQLFDIMSGHGEVDHPLCQECTDTLMNNMVKQLRSSEKEHQMYQDYLAKLESAPLPDEKSLQTDLEQLTLSKKELLCQMDDVQSQRAQVAAELKAVQDEFAEMKEAEKKYWKELCELQYQERALMDEQLSVDSQLQHSQAQLNFLERTNVYNCTFHIWHTGHFGTINGFRLGRLPTVPVEWSEINTAWGQAVLLLHCLARRLKIRFERYRLVPYGNVSYVETIQDKKRQLPLYCSGGLRFFWDTKFDNAMVAFLDLLNQFKSQVEATAREDDSVRPFVFPYQIVKETIGEPDHMYSVRIQFNTEEHWTKALKHVLVTLKWGLAYLTTKLNPLSASS